MAGHVPVCYSCVVNITFGWYNNEFLILDKFIFQESNHITIVTMVMIMMPLPLMVS